MTAAAAARGALVTVDGVAHHVTGAQVALVQRGRVLMQLRPWPPGWELPGGHCDPGEEPADTAAREALEETGLEVRITTLVGVYSWRGLRRVADAVYLGEVVGGEERRSLEAWAIREVSPDRPPLTMFPWCRQRLADALASAGGAPPVHRVQRITVRHVLGFASSWLLAPIDRWLRHRRRRGVPR